jgi:prepilin signal peptidase PulO-like enzyme (type II secretory pathway)
LQSVVFFFSFFGFGLGVVLAWVGERREEKEKWVCKKCEAFLSLMDNFDFF